MNRWGCGVGVGGYMVRIGGHGGGGRQMGGYDMVTTCAGFHYRRVRLLLCLLFSLFWVTVVISSCDFSHHFYRLILN